MLDGACLSDDELIHYALLGMLLPTPENLRRLAELAALYYIPTKHHGAKR